MLKMNFNVHTFQSCIFIWRKKEKFVIVLLYVDDILICGNSSDKIIETKRQLKENFEMKDMREPEKFLGIEIRHDKVNKTMFLNQQSYVEKLFKKFNMENCKPVHTQ